MSTVVCMIFLPLKTSQSHSLFLNWVVSFLDYIVFFIYSEYSFSVRYIAGNDSLPICKHLLHLIISLAVIDIFWFYKSHLLIVRFNSFQREYCSSDFLHLYLARYSLCSLYLFQHFCFHTDAFDPFGVNICESR